MTTTQFFTSLCMSIAALAILATSTMHAADEKHPDSLRVYIGTYTGAKSKGIYLSQLDLKTGKLSEPELAGEVDNPSFLAIHPSRRYLYAVGEVSNFGGQKAGAVSAFSIDAKTGQLTLLNQQSSGGTGPCHLVVDRQGKNVLAANYGGGSVCVLPIDGHGRLGSTTAFIQHEGSGANPQRQAQPHAHSINLDAANHFAVAADLGLDKVLVYRFDAEKGTLAPNDPPFTAVAPGAGPRHFAFHPSGHYAYVINEIHLTVTAFTYDAEHGVLKEIQTLSTLPAGTETKGLSTAEVQVHPSGKFLYGSNRGHDTIAIFGIDQHTGKLTAVGHKPTGGKTPRNFALDPTGTFLLAENQSSGTIVVFRIDQKTGELEATGHSIEVPSPVCVRMMVVPQQ
jgi:6-phosphogluconolactonase